MWFEKCEDVLKDEGKIICDLTTLFMNKDKEIERLNNIIDEVEDMLSSPFNVECINQNNYILNRIKELKEGDKEWQ